MKHYKILGLMSAIALLALLIQGINHIVNADSTKLNGSLQGMGNVVQARFSPDEKYIIYTADQLEDDVFEIFSVPVTGGTPVRLNNDLPDGMDIFGFSISPDSQRVIYVPRNNGVGTQLFSVPITGPATANVQLNESHTGFGSGTKFQISPDSNTVVYESNLERPAFSDLYRVPIAGPATASEKLHEPFQEFGEVYKFTISPNGQYVVYSAYKPPQTEPQIQLFSTPLLGPVSNTITLTEPLVQGGFIYQIDISPDNATVVYYAKQDNNNITELYSVPIIGPTTANVKLNDVLDGGKSVDSQYFITPDSSRIVYLAQLTGQDEKEIYTAPINGPASSSVKLTVDLGVNESINDSSWHVTQDGTNLVYAVYKLGFGFEGELQKLYRVPIDGTSADYKILLAIPPADEGAISFGTTPNGQHVVYIFRSNSSPSFEIYSIPIEGPLGSETKLNVPLTSGGSAASFRISPNSYWILYTAKIDATAARELYVVPVIGPAAASIKINSTLVAGGNVNSLDSKISPNGTWIAYLADQETDGMQELYLSSGNALFFTHSVYLPVVVAK